LHVPQPLLAIVVGLGVCQVSIFLTTIYLHRAVAHKAITLAGPVRFACRVLLWTTTGIRPREWAAVHRRHHAHTDVEGDPHSPVLLGYKAVQLGNVKLYRRAARDGTTVERYARDLPQDAWDRYLFDHSFLGLGIGVTLLCLTLGWEWGLLAAAVHTIVYLGLNAAVNAVGHTFGRTPYENTARNSRWLAAVTAGEGWHNNHHAAPTSARFGLTRWQLDPGWWLIHLLVKARLASVRLSEVRFKSPRRPVGSQA
jgi:stearoyl-CoA desaturase (Delta-9 desaturase)